MKIRKTCAYCGRSGLKLTRDHVVPGSMYDTFLHHNQCQLLTVAACLACNKQTSIEEDHFRLSVALASTANPAANSAFEKSLRAFDKGHGDSRWKWIAPYLRQDRNDPLRTRVYPGEDPRTLKVVAKSIRGLHFHHHKIAIPEERVSVSLFPYQMPEEFKPLLTYFGDRCPDVFDYWMAHELPEDFSSIWLVRFYANCQFLGLVVNPGISLDYQ